MEDIALTNSLMLDEANSRSEISPTSYDNSVTYNSTNRNKHIKRQQQFLLQKQQEKQQQLLLQQQQHEEQILNARNLATDTNQNNQTPGNSRRHSVYPPPMDASLGVGGGGGGMSMATRGGSFKVSPNSLTTVSEVPGGGVGTGSGGGVHRGMSLSMPKVHTGGNSPSPNRPSSLAASSENMRQREMALSHVPEVKPPVRITSRIVFLKVGQVDTRNERYDAEAYIECFWEDDQIFKILSDPNMAKNMVGPNAMQTMLRQADQATLNKNSLVNLKNIINNISVLEYDANMFWSPQLYIENAIGDLKEEVRHKLEIVEREGCEILTDESATTPGGFSPKDQQYKQLMSNLTVRVCEMRKIRGVFYERLELYDFPMDTQELSITLTSKRNAKEIQFVANEKDPCSINTEDFLDQQEWDLFGHVTTTHKTIYDPWRKYERAGFAITCFIARKPGYYLYNAYMLVFLITALGFVPFAFDPGAPQFRCQVTGLLLLTSVNFRWIVTQRLPSVGYLTSLDKYAIGSLLCLVLFCVWHSLIGSTMIASDADARKYIDKIVLLSAACFYLLYNLFCIVWFIRMHRTIKKFQDESELLAAKAAAVRSENRRRKDEEQELMTATKQSLAANSAVSTPQPPGSNNRPQSLPQQQHAIATTQNEHSRQSMIKKPPPSPTATSAPANPLANMSGSGSGLSAKSSSVKSRSGRQQNGADP